MWFKKDPIAKLCDQYAESLAEMRPTDDGFKEMSEALARLMEARAKISQEKPIDPNVVLTILWSVVSTLLIIDAERDDVVGRSKAFSERVKPRICSHI